MPLSDAQQNFESLMSAFIFLAQDAARCGMQETRSSLLLAIESCVLEHYADRVDGEELNSLVEFYLAVAEASVIDLDAFVAAASS